jgi:hypothetical protein
MRCEPALHAINSWELEPLYFGFSNLKKVIEPISEDFERYMLSTLVDELNSLFPLSLATDFVCDRFLEEDVFDETKNRTALVLVGASHLWNVASLIESQDWQVFDLTTPGWRISDNAVKKKMDEIIRLGEQIELDKATVILQLYDNSVFMVGGTGGTRHLPARDATGVYHVDGELVVADKAGVKELTSKLAPLIRALGGAKKLFLSPLSRYWLNPCCSDPGHLTNYKEPGYLRKLGGAIAALREYVRDSLYTRHTSNFRVLCPNKILGIGQRRDEMPMEDARELAATWGGDPVHPAKGAYRIITEGILKDLSNADSRYTNPPRLLGSVAKKPRIDLSLERDAWVSGCTAALPRRDSHTSTRGPVMGGKTRGGGTTRGAWKRGNRYPRGPFRGRRGRY